MFKGKTSGLSCLICFDENNIEPSSAIKFSQLASKNVGLAGFSKGNSLYQIFNDVGTIGERKRDKKVE